LREASDVAIVRSEELAQGGTASTIILNAAASAIDKFYNTLILIIVDGIGAGQARTITTYNGTTKIATIGVGWAVVPDSTSKYVIRGSACVHVYGINDGVIKNSTLNADVGSTEYAQNKIALASKKGTVSALVSDTYPEPGQGKPPSTVSIITMLRHIFKTWRNKKTNDGTTRKLFADGGVTVDQKSSVSEDQGTVTTGEMESGP